MQQTAAPAVKKRKTLLVGDEQGAKDTEYDWRDRLREWKHVQTSKGVIVDLAQAGPGAQSAPVAILGLLQGDYSRNQIADTVESSLVNGLRRSAGLNMIGYGMSLNGSDQIFFDMLQWLQGSLRDRKNQAVHYLDGIAGCGNSAEASIRDQFFKVIDRVLQKIRISCSNEELVYLLNGLCWSFSTEDHARLAKLGMFDTLLKGDGSKLNKIRVSWGLFRCHYTEQTDDFTPKFVNMGYRLQCTTEFLQNQVLAGLVQTEEEPETVEQVESGPKLLKRKTSIDQDQSSLLVGQMVDMAFSNLETAIAANRLVPTLVADEDSMAQKLLDEQRFQTSAFF